MKIDSKKPLTQEQVREINGQLARITVLEAACNVALVALSYGRSILEERSWVPRRGPTACEAGPAIISAMEAIVAALYPKKEKQLDKRRANDE